ncbi:MAG: aminoacyl-tRNA hydrolase [Patescibacteria group bacterium]|nr:aminoacyl-tRNA hydrolase [Patescibacteria group bacterium]
MLLIAGLGNPGDKYEETRHNVGFMVLDKLADDFGVTFKEDKKRNAEVAEYTMTFPRQKKKVRMVLVKPQTYMNKSGEAVAKIARYHGIDPRHTWVIHDDLDIELGIIRTRFGGTSAGQKGVESIISHLGTKDFYRFRFGIKPEGGQKIPAEEFVLKKFSKAEREVVDLKIKELIEILKESAEFGPEPSTR